MADLPREISELLARWETGDKESLRVLFPLIYKDLRRLAHHYLGKERPAPFQNRAHFVAVCALLMRQILVEYERARRAAKRGGGGEKITLEDAHGLMKGRAVDLIALDDALSSLARLDPQQSKVEELRFFGGLSIEETAVALGISPSTVGRLWSTARVWLYQEMNGEARA